MSPLEARLQSRSLLAPPVCQLQAPLQPQALVQRPELRQLPALGRLQALHLFLTSARMTLRLNLHRRRIHRSSRV